MLRRSSREDGLDVFTRIHIESLQANEPSVGTIDGNQLLVRALLYQSALTHDNNVVSVPDSRQAMSNGNDRPAERHFLQRSLNA